MPIEGSSGSAVPATPRWLLAIPDAIRQLDALDRDLLTRRDLERLFGVSKVRAVALMTAFGAGRTGHLLTLPRAARLRQLRRHRTRAAFRGEATRRDRVVTAIRVAVPSEALEARLAGLPEGVSVEAGRIEVRFSSAQDAVGRLFALAQALSRRLVLEMIKRRAATADLPPSTCCHTFRATGITAYLSNGGTLEHAQQIAGHASPKTTKLYDRTADTITVDEIEHIVI